MKWKTFLGKNIYPSRVLLYCSIPDAIQEKVRVFPKGKKKGYPPYAKTSWIRGTLHTLNPKGNARLGCFPFFIVPPWNGGPIKNKFVYSEYLERVLITSSGNKFFRNQKRNFWGEKFIFIHFIFDPSYNGSRWFLRGQRGVWLYFKVTQLLK